MADDACQAQANVSAAQSRSLRILHRFYTLLIAWNRSLFSKIIIAFLGVGLFSYSLGALVGWSMFVEAAKEQWNNQARTNLQIASSTLRGVYTYVVIRTDEDGHVERIVTAQPIGDDDSILFTGFTPTDVLALVAAQTNHDAWLFRHDAQTGQFFSRRGIIGACPQPSSVDFERRGPSHRQSLGG